MITSKLLVFQYFSQLILLTKSHSMYRINHNAYSFTLQFHEKYVYLNKIINIIGIYNNRSYDVIQLNSNLTIDLNFNQTLYANNRLLKKHFSKS